MRHGTFELLCYPLIKLRPDGAQAGLQHLSDLRWRGALIEEIAKISVGPLAVALTELRRLIENGEQGGATRREARSNSLRLFIVRAKSAIAPDAHIRDTDAGGGHCVRRIDQARKVEIIRHVDQTGRCA